MQFKFKSMEWEMHCSIRSQIGDSPVGARERRFRRVLIKWREDVCFHLAIARFRFEFIKSDAVIIYSSALFHRKLWLPMQTSFGASAKGANKTAARWIFSALFVCLTWHSISSSNIWRSSPRLWSRRTSGVGEVVVYGIIKDFFFSCRLRFKGLAS